MTTAAGRASPRLPLFCAGHARSAEPRSIAPDRFAAARTLSPVRERSAARLPADTFRQRTTRDSRLQQAPSPLLACITLRAVAASGCRECSLRRRLAKRKMLCEGKKHPRLAALPAPGTYDNGKPAERRGRKATR